jgi:lipopolysaccharide export system permease protein
METSVKILDRYLGRAVMGGTLLTLAVLLPLIAFFLLADEVNGLGEVYGFADALAVAGLSLPRYAYHLFPIATLIGSLVGLGALASHSELVAMRATGMSVARILYAALKAGLVLALLALALGEFVAPPAERMAVQWRNDVKSGQVTMRTPQGLWARDGESYISIREILPGARLSDISIYEIDANRRLVLATHADSANYVDGQWVLKGISRSRIADEGVEAQPLASAAWSSLLNPSLLRLVVVEPQALPVWDLARYVSHMSLNGQDPGKYETEMWGKIVHPFLILTMILLSIPILFGSSRSTGLGVRLFLGIMLGMAYYLISRGFFFLAIHFGLAAWLAAILPLALFALAALWVLRRIS